MATTTAAAANGAPPSASALAPAPAPAPAGDPTTALSQRQVDSYMGELLSYSLERLQSEPRVLSEEAARLDRHAQQAAVANYRAFLDGSDALLSAQHSLRTSLARLDELLDQGVAGLSAACEQFAQTAAHTIAAGNANKALLASQPALLDLLEAPSLAEQCVRAGCYDEALELQAFVARLAMLHPELPVARALKARMEKVNGQMLAALLARLRSSSLTLPECLRLVGYLRRAPATTAATTAGGASGGSSSSSSSSSFQRRLGGGPSSADDEEAELRLQFLRCRDEWLTGLVRDLELEMAAGAAGGAAVGATAAGGGAAATGNAAASPAAALPSLEPYGGRAAEYVKRLIDLHRLHLFDIVMQYRAVFGDGAAAAAAAGAATPGATTATTATTTTPTSALPTPSRSGAVLPSWLSHRVGELVESLARALPHVTDGASLASAMEHAAYAGASLGRVGADYTAQLAPVFESCSLKLFGAYLGAASDAFRARLESHRWIALAGKGAGAAKATTADAAPSSSDGGATNPQDSSSALVPPAALMEHPPVAVFVNGVLAALNELRHCATWGSRAPCGRALQSTLDGAALAMVSFSHSHPLPEGEMQQFRAAARMLADVAAPFLVACFSRVFAATGVAALGPAGSIGGVGGDARHHHRSHQHHHPEVRSIKAVLAEIIDC